MEDGTGKGIVIALFHTNTTGRLAPLNGMVLAGQIEFLPGEDRLETFWEWQSGIPLLTTSTAQEPPSINTTSTPTNATSAETMQQEHMRKKKEEGKNNSNVSVRDNDG
jgi:hypothetical protein